MKLVKNNTFGVLFLLMTFSTMVMADASPESLGKCVGYMVYATSMQKMKVSDFSKKSQNVFSKNIGNFQRDQGAITKCKQHNETEAKCMSGLPTSADAVFFKSVMNGINQAGKNHDPQAIIKSTDEVCEAS